MIEARIRAAFAAPATDKTGTAMYPAVEVVFIDTDSRRDVGAHTYILRADTPTTNLGDVAAAIKGELERLEREKADPPPDPDTPPTPPPTSKEVAAQVAELVKLVGTTIVPAADLKP